MLTLIWVINLGENVSMVLPLIWQECINSHTKLLTMVILLSRPPNEVKPKRKSGDQ